MGRKRVLITGSGAICGAGRSPSDIFSAVTAGRSAIAPIEQWDPAHWPAQLAAEVRDYNAAALTGDRKLLKTFSFTVFPCDNPSGYAPFLRHHLESAQTPSAYVSA